MSPWVTAWSEMFGMAPDGPQWLLATLALIFTFVMVILPSGAVLSYMDRKLGADLQARIGPNRAGPAGILQPIADLLKLLQKEARKEWTWHEAFWTGIHTMALYSTVAVLPLGSLAVLIDTDMSALLPFWAALVLALGTMLLGLSQRSVPGWFGGIRGAAQALSGAFPALIALLCAGVRSGSFRWTLIATTQGSSPWSWTAFSSPFQLIAFVVFVCAGLVLLEIPPLDGGHSVSDIHGGVASHLDGRRLTLFRLSRFYGFFLWSVISVVLFLGAWELPFGMSAVLREAGATRTLQLGELSYLLAKTFALMMVIMWVARVNPRGRVDQITDFAWKVLSPFSLAALVGASLWASWGVWA